GQLGVGRVGDVGVIGLALGHGAQVLEAAVGVRLVQVLGVVQVSGRVADVDADAHAQQVVDGRHTARVPAGQVVVDGDQVDALARERAEVKGEAGDQRL